MASTLALHKNSHKVVSVTHLSIKKLVIALSFSAIFVSIPWSNIFTSIDGTDFPDRQNYLRQLENFDLSYDRGIYETRLDYYTGEFIWGWLLRTLSDAGMAGETILDAIAFGFLVSISILILRELSAPYLLFLINPITISMAFSQSRSALMVTLLMLAVQLPKKYLPISIFLVCTAAFVHTSAPLFLLIFWTSTTRNKSEHHSPSFLFPLLVGIFVSFATGPWMSDLLTLIGDRRAEYSNMGSGILFLSFWAFGLIYLIAIWSKFGSNSSMRIALSVLALTTASLITDSYASRFIAAFFPYLVISLCLQFHLQKKNSIIVILFAVYLSLLWLIRII